MGNVLAFAPPLAGAETATPLDVFPDLSHEKYGHSLQTFRAMGEIALANTLATQKGLPPTEMGPQEEAARQQFSSAVAEMIKTDEELGPELEINRLDEYEVRDGKVLAYDGKTFLTDMCWSGAQRSRQEAEKDPRMWTQYARDYNDGLNAEAVDGMVAGRFAHNTRFGVSLDPKEAMARDGAKFWTGLNYREGMAFAQLYHVMENGRVLTGTFSIDASDKDVWRTTFREFGVEIPEDETTDNWLRYAIEANLTDEQALQLVTSVRARYYQNRAVENKRHSINDIMAENQKVLDEIFADMYKPLSQALAEGRVSDLARTLAHGLLQDTSSEKLTPHIRQQLIRVASGSVLDDTNMRVLETMIRYGAVENIRNQVKARVRGYVLPPAVPEITDLVPGRSGQATGISAGQMMANRLVMNIAAGVRADRAYGACGSEARLTGGNSGAAADERDPSNPQAAYGDRGREGDAESEPSPPEKIRCIACDVYSKREAVIQKDRWACPHCKYAVDICTGKPLHPSEPPELKRSTREQGAKILLFSQRKKDASAKVLPAARQPVTA